MSDYIVEITQENAQAILIDESFQRPVIVDFWADWCEPCKVLMPLLEKLAHEYAGAFLLAKLNCDQYQMIAQQFGVRSLPTVVVMKDGQPVDGFAGAQPENAIRSVLEKYLPKPWDSLLAQAHDLLSSGDSSAALPLLRQACEDSRDRADIVCTYAQALIELKRYDDAQAQLDKVKLADQDDFYEQVIAQLHLKQQAAKSPEVEALERQHQADPENLETAYELAVQYTNHDHHKDAMELLISILRKDRDFRDGGAKKTLLDLFKTLGTGDPLVVEYQRKLFSLMY